MRFAKDSAGHLLAQAFMLPEFYAGRRSYEPTKKRTGVRYTKRRDKPARDNFLTLLQHTTLVDWKALRAKAAALVPEGGRTNPHRQALDLVLRQDRNVRRAARRLARSARPRPLTVSMPKLCAAPGRERLPELHGKPMCGPHWYLVPGPLRRSILAGKAGPQGMIAAKAACQAVR